MLAELLSPDNGRNDQAQSEQITGPSVKASYIPPGQKRNLLLWSCRT
jgi:hypothetical protein